MRTHRAITLALLTGLLAPAAAAGVWTVASTGPADFTQISAAVAAAQEGDLILVSPPEGPVYSSFTIDGKSLAISTALAGVGISTREITIKNLAAGKSVVLRGLVAIAPTSPPAPGLTVTNCAGAVHLEDCSFTGSSPTALGAFGRAGIATTNAANVQLNFSSATGGKGASSGTNDWDGAFGGVGLILDGSTVWVHGAQLHGGNGGGHFDPDVLPGEHFAAGSGGPGASINDGSTLTCADSSLTGGNGGTQVFGPPQALGGAGISVFEDSLLRERDNDYFTGFSPKKHVLVPKIAADPDEVETYPSVARSLATDSPRHELETLHLEVHGQSADQALLVFGLAPYGQWFSNLQGGLLADPLGAALIPLGTVPGAGELNVPFALPSLPPGLEHVEVWLQLAIAAQGRVTLENSSVVVLLDASL